MTMCGTLAGGMFSAPVTRWRMPQIQRAPWRFVQHQAAAIRYIGTRGIQKSASITNA